MATWIPSIVPTLSPFPLYTKQIHEKAQLASLQNDNLTTWQDKLGICIYAWYFLKE